MDNQEKNPSNLEQEKLSTKKRSRSISRVCDCCGNWFSTSAEQPDLCCQDCFNYAISKED